MIPREAIRARRLLVLAWVIAMSTALSGCGTHSTPTEPDSTAATEPAEADFERELALREQDFNRYGYFPLQIGNQWTYSRDIVTLIRGDSCTPAKCPPFATVRQYTEHRELTGTEWLFGREYVLEAQRTWGRLTFSTTPDTTTYWIRYRQDRTGLYEADVAVTDPPGAEPVASNRTGAMASRDRPLSELVRERGAELSAAQAAGHDAAMTRMQAKLDVVTAALASYSVLSASHPPRRHGGVLDNELTRLKYPLRPGQHWTILDQPRFTSRVVRRERLELPAGRFSGYKIRIDADGFGPQDRVFLWYSRQGLLKFDVHLELPYTTYEDPYGYGLTMITDDTMVLESLDLVDP